MGYDRNERFEKKSGVALIDLIVRSTEEGVS